jgi:DNA-binding beta-propeller fold protein YncE
VIDTQTNKVLGQVLVAGVLGYAQADGAGQVYIGYTDRDAILRFSAAAVEAQLKQIRQEQEEEEAAASSANRSEPAPQDSSQPASAKPAPAKPVELVPPTLDWTMPPNSSAAAAAGLHLLSFGRSCGVPHGFALDGPDDRLFAACEDSSLEVLNTNTGQPVTTVPIGWGVNQIGYDPVRGLIYAATGAGDGQLTVIRRTITDTYAVIQDLPTRRRAYVMAINSDTGNVYLVTDLMGVDLTKPGGIGTLRMTPIQGSFAVLEIGH